MTKRSIAIINYYYYFIEIVAFIVVGGICTHAHRAWTASLVDGIPLAIAGLFSKGSMAFKHWSKVVRLQLTVDCPDPVADDTQN